MKKKDRVLSPDDPHINLLLEKQLKGKRIIRHVHSDDLQEILNALTPTQANFVAYQVKMARRSLWQHAKEELEEFLLELPNKLLPQWITDKI